MARSPASRRKRQRLLVVVRQQLRNVTHALAGHRLDPVRRELVLARPRRARDLPVGNVPDQCVPEGVLDLAVHRRHSRPSDELLAGELVEAEVRDPIVDPAHRCDRARPEDLANDGGVVDQ